MQPKLASLKLLILLHPPPTYYDSKHGHPESLEQILLTLGTETNTWYLAEFTTVGTIPQTSHSSATMEQSLC